MAIFLQDIILIVFVIETEFHGQVLYQSPLARGGVLGQRFAEFKDRLSRVWLKKDETTHRVVSTMKFMQFVKFSVGNGRDRSLQ